MNFSGSEIRSQEGRHQKFASMSNAAVQLDLERKSRLGAIRMQEADSLIVDHAGQERGNKGDFLFEVNRRARAQDLEARLRACRNSLIEI